MNEIRGLRVDAMSLGEAETRIRYAVKHNSPDRVSNVALGRLLAEYDALRAMEQRVRGLHRQVIDDSWPTPGCCEECLTGDEQGELDYVPYPCPTIRALDGAP